MTGLARLMTDLLTTADIAARDGCTPGAILARSKVRGISPTQIRGKMMFWTPEQALALIPGRRGRRPKAVDGPPVDPDAQMVPGAFRSLG